MSQQPIVTKASGEQMPFVTDKLKQSLRRAGVSDAILNTIVEKVQGRLYDGITTKEIYRIAFNLLKNDTSSSAAKYKLKKAIMELGPSGFPFEKYIAELFKHQGFQTMVGQVVQGRCVTHEIDVIAEKGNLLSIVECKFHNQQGYMCDVKIPLYVHSRFRDVEAHWRTLPEYKDRVFEGWIVTNTRFSDDAAQYGACARLHLLAWDYPQRGGLRELIDKSGLYPVTCLTTLTNYEKTRLLEMGIVLCKEVQNNEPLLRLIGISDNRLKNIIRESREVSIIA
ncbi:MAG: ATP cone domain-containing protein [Spirosomataceae bacterium]